MSLGRLRRAVRRATRGNGTVLPVGRDHVVWAYRLFLDREPESESAITLKLAAHASTPDLRRDFMTSAEFHQKNGPDIAYSADRCVVIKELANNLRLFVDLSDVAIGLNVVRDRYEASESRFIEQTLRPGDSVLDIGANVGFHTIQMAARVGAMGRVHAFEPLPQNLVLLERSIIENHFEDRVVVEKAAVGDACRSAEMVFIPLEERSFNSGGAYLRTTDRELLPGHQAFPVQVLALDRCELRRPIRFVKIDVEGAEPLAMRGAHDLLLADRPTILSEISPSQVAEVTGLSAAAFIAEMATLGYECRLLEDGRAGEIIRDAPDERIRSFVFLPIDKPSRAL
jgi:FkbM family methyltransferase